MKRKVIQLAGRTLVVSLPSNWAKKQNVQKGDELNVDEQEDRLVVSSEKAITEKKTRISIVGLDPIVKRTLGALYKIGYDEIEVDFAAEELETAQEVVREEFIGFEVVYKGKNTLQVKNISSIDPEEFDTILRRMFLVILQMGSDLIEAEKSSDTHWLQSIAYMDKDVNRYADFCRRVLNKYGYSKYSATPPMYYIIEQLERIGDNYKDISKLLGDGSLAPSNEVLSLLHKVNTLLRQFYELFYKFDLKKLAEFAQQRNDIMKQINTCFNTCQRQELRLLFFIESLLENTFDMNGALMAINL